MRIVTCFSLVAAICLIRVHPASCSGETVKVLPRRVILVLERSEGTRWVWTSVRSFANDLLDQLDLSREVVLYEFTREPVQAAHTDALTPEQVRLFRERISKTGGKDPFVNFDELFGALRKWNGLPCCVVLLTRGISNPSSGHSFKDVLRLLGEHFPASAGHSVLVVGLSDEIEKSFQRMVAPKEYSFLRLDTRVSGGSPLILEPLLNQRLEAEPSPVPVQVRRIVVTPTSTPTPLPILLPVAPTRSPSPTWTWTPTSFPTARPTATEMVVVPVVTVSEPPPKQGPSRSWLRVPKIQFPGWVLVAGLCGFTMCLAVPLIYRRAVRRALGALPGLDPNEEVVRILHASVVLDETGEMVASQEFVLGTGREEITVGSVGHARMYVPEVSGMSKFFAHPDGTVVQAKGFRRDPVLPGSSVRLSDKHSLYFEFELRPAGQAEDDEEEVA